MHLSLLLCTAILSQCTQSRQALPADTHLHTLNPARDRVRDLFASHPETAVSPDPEQNAWDRAFCKGQKLHRAMSEGEEQGNKYLPLHSPWDGPLFKELNDWGYSEVPGARDEDCNFQNHQTDVFEDLGIDRRPASKGGPNICYFIEHMNANLVDDRMAPNSQKYKAPDGRELQVTEAHAEIGANNKDGVMYMMDILSAGSAAKSNWESYKLEDLPALRSISDIAWGFWNRAAAGNVANLKYVMVMDIMNDDTSEIIDTVLEQRKLRELPDWPGLDFKVGDEKDVTGSVLLGSPNGLGAGFLVAQHKKQLGHKIIQKITLFGLGRRGSPHMLLWITDKTSTAVIQTELDIRSLDKRSVSVEIVDDRNFLRVHKLEWKL